MDGHRKCCKDTALYIHMWEGGGGGNTRNRKKKDGGIRRVEKFEEGGWKEDEGEQEWAKEKR